MRVLVTLLKQFVMMADKSWEEAVLWLRQEPDQTFLVQACYYDDPLLEAAMRFADSEEWQAVRLLLAQSAGSALDLGAGRGISSYALARDGWQVVAFEPDPSPVVGAGAIRSLTAETNLPIQVVEGYGETLPFPDCHFDLVYGRQVLHHARDLPQLMREVARVLKPIGQFIATREHVISKKEDLPVFLMNHPLHKFYGGENAYLLQEYLQAINHSGLQIDQIFGSFDTVINYFPISYEQWLTQCRSPFTRRIGHRLTNLLANDHHIVGRWLLKKQASVISQANHIPGRLYSFTATQPL